MALILDRVVLLHNPHTAGTWCHRVFYELGVLRGVMHSSRNYPHPDVDDVRAVFADSRLYCGFVRQPLGWLRSYWSSAWLAGGKGVERLRFPPSPWAAFAACEAQTFRDFVAKYLATCPGAVGELTHRYVRDVAFVGRYERLVEDVCLVLALNGTVVDRERVAAIPPENVTEGIAPEDVRFLPPDLADAVNAAEAPLWQAYYA